MTIELLATVIVPSLAAALSLIGSLFSEISQRGRIKSDIEIYRSLTSNSDDMRMMPDSLNMLSEHIERDEYAYRRQGTLDVLAEGALFPIVGRGAFLCTCPPRLTPRYGRDPFPSILLRIFPSADTRGLVSDVGAEKSVSLRCP